MTMKLFEELRAAALKVHEKRELRVLNKTSTDRAEMYLYDEISWWGVSAERFVQELNGITAPSMTLYINSPGGDVTEGLAIFNALKRHAAKVDVVVDGLAASAASYITQAGDTVTMSQGSMMMIHQAWGFAGGFAGDFRAQADVLDMMSKSIAGIYAARAGGTVDSWMAEMAANDGNGTWYSAEKAVESGLADSVEGQLAAENKVDLTVFRNWGAKTPEKKASDARIRDWRKVAELAVAGAHLELGVSYGHGN